MPFPWKTWVEMALLADVQELGSRKSTQFFENFSIIPISTQLIFHVLLHLVLRTGSDPEPTLSALHPEAFDLRFHPAR